MRIAYLTQLRVGYANCILQKLKHKFEGAINPLCPINDGTEDVEQFLLLWNSFRSIDAIFSLVLMMHSKPTDAVMLQTILFCNFFFMEI